MNVTFRLMQESGVSGPKQTVEAEGESQEALEKQARVWAKGQTGHPWDVLTVETEDGDLFEVEM